MLGATGTYEQREREAMESAYQRLFAALDRHGVQGLSVTQSVKLSRGKVNTNRYFVRFTEDRMNRDAVKEVCLSLRLPMQADAWIQTQAGGWGTLGAVSAALVRGEMHYRAYFRTGEHEPGDTYLWAVEWPADGARGEHGRRRYRVLDLHSADEMRALLGAQVRPEDARERAIFEGWLALLRRGGERVQVLEVVESNTSRLSFDAAPAFEQPLRMGAIAQEWALWCAAFGIDASGLGAWWGEVADGKLENTTFGRDGNGELFVGLYFGRYERPMESCDLRAGAARAASVKASAAAAPLEEPKVGQRVFVLGEIHVTPRDQNGRTQEAVPQNGANLHATGSPVAPLAAMLAESPEASTEFHWTVERNGMPLYVLNMPMETAREGLHGFVQEMAAPRSSDEALEPVPIVAVGGRMTGRTEEVRGHTVPVLTPNARAMFRWRPAGLLETMAEPVPPGIGSAMNLLQEKAHGTGTKAAERAYAFAATQPLAWVPAFVAAGARGLQLAVISAQPHHAGLFGDGRVDVHLLFQRARVPEASTKLEAVLTVDVSDDSPFATGPVMFWERL